MSFKLKRSLRKPMSEINVTPFVDVMLVLLIIFMVTAPLLTVGVQVDLPETSADSLPEDGKKYTIITPLVDSGVKYLSKVFNTEYLAENKITIKDI